METIKREGDRKMQLPKSDAKYVVFTPGNLRTSQGDNWTFKFKPVQLETKN